MAQGKYGIYGVHGIDTLRPLATTTPLSTWTCYTIPLPLTGNGTVVVNATTRARGYYTEGRDHVHRGRRGKEYGYLYTLHTRRHRVTKGIVLAKTERSELAGDLVT